MHHRVPASVHGRGCGRLSAARGEAAPEIPVVENEIGLLSEDQAASRWTAPATTRTKNVTMGIAVDGDAVTW